MFSFHKGSTNTKIDTLSIDTLRIDTLSIDTSSIDTLSIDTLSIKIISIKGSYTHAMWGGAILQSIAISIENFLSPQSARPLEMAIGLSITR